LELKDCNLGEKIEVKISKFWCATFIVHLVLCYKTLGGLVYQCKIQKTITLLKDYKLAFFPDNKRTAEWRNRSINPYLMIIEPLQHANGAELSAFFSISLRSYGGLILAIALAERPHPPNPEIGQDQPKLDQLCKWVAVKYQLEYVIEDASGYSSFLYLTTLANTSILRSQL
jgi:hypothetical protein